MVVFNEKVFQWKQKAHGPQRSPEKPVQIHLKHVREAMKYIITLIRGRKRPLSLFFWRFEWSLFLKPWVPYTKVRFVPRLVEMAHAVVLKKILKLGKCISTIMLRRAKTRFRRYRKQFQLMYFLVENP